MIKSIWKDPVWSAVIAAGIIGLVGVIGSYFLGYWPKISSAAASARSFLFASSDIPNWVTGLLLIGVVPTLLLLAVVVWELLRGSSGSSAAWTSYTSDQFFGLRWRWLYTDGRISNLNSFCPSCDYQVFPYDVSSYNFVDRIAFSCDSCRSSLGEHDESHSRLKNKVERFIQQKIRNNTWHSSGGA